MSVSGMKSMRGREKRWGRVSQRVLSNKCYPIHGHKEKPFKKNNIYIYILVFAPSTLRLTMKHTQSSTDHELCFCSRLPDYRLESSVCFWWVCHERRKVLRLTHGLRCAFTGWVIQRATLWLAEICHFNTCSMVTSDCPSQLLSSLLRLLLRISTRLTHTHTHLCLHTHTHKHTQALKHEYTCLKSRAQVHAHNRTHTHTQSCTCAYTHTHVHSQESVSLWKVGEGIFHFPPPLSLEAFPALGNGCFTTEEV